MPKKKGQKKLRELTELKQRLELQELIIEQELYDTAIELSKKRKTTYIS